MGGVHTSMVRAAHEYTRSSAPWIIPDSRTPGDRLMHYLSGGGMRAFGRTIRQEEVSLRHRRFWEVSAVLAALWLVFWVF